MSQVIYKEEKKEFMVLVDPKQVGWCIWILRSFTNPLFRFHSTRSGKKVRTSVRYSWFFSDDNPIDEYCTRFRRFSDITERFFGG
jgi:hypothetical protein